jgi:biopolymer transport protein ExbD
MRFPRNAKIFRGQLDAAPLVGVLFLLVIFLLLNSTFVFTPGVRIQLPELADLPGVSGPARVVALDRYGQVYFENQVVAAETLRGRLQQAVRESGQPLTLVVQADKAATLDSWMRLSKLAREAGVKEVLFAARPPLFAAQPGAPSK